MNKRIEIIIIVILLVVIGWAVSDRFQKNTPPITTVPPTPMPVPNPAPTPEPEPLPKPAPPSQTPNPNPTPPATSTPTEIIRGNTNKKQVIFTFDGGAGSHSGEEILDVLAKHNVKGTFFLTGKFAETFPDLTKKIAAVGHEIYNHTYNHPDLKTISNEQIVQEFIQTEKIIYNLTNRTTQPYFRPPFGSRDQRVLEIAGEHGYQSVFWTTDALDWKVGISEAEVKKRIYDNLKPGALYLMHIGDDITGNILDEVFTEIKSRGYSIVSLTQGL
jgi:peptidoglycan/xylan/chitin deacetylase (PgdA/CDA1 family)